MHSDLFPVEDDPRIHDPRVVVFDLDGTIWTPEMYQLRGGSPFRVQKERVFDCHGERIELLADAVSVLERLKKEFPHVSVGIASTCDEPEWAKELLLLIKASDGERCLRHFFRDDLIEIYFARDKLRLKKERASN